MLVATLWPLVAVYALVADAAVVSGPRYKGARAAVDDAVPTAKPIAKRQSNAAAYSSSVSAARAQQSATYLAQAQAAEAGRNSGWTPMGCIRDSPTRTLNGLFLSWDNMTLPICMNNCFTRGYTYGGVQYGRECWCGSTINSGTWVGNPPDGYIKSGDTYGTLVPYAECQNFPCAGDKTTNCGSNWRNNVFKLTDTAAANAAISASASASAASVSAAAYSSSAAVYSSSANAFSSSSNSIASASAAKYSSSSLAAYSTSAAAYSTSAAAFSSSSLSASASAYSSKSRADAAASSAASVAAYSSGVAYSQSSSAAAYSQSVSNAQASAAAYSQSTSLAAYSQSVASAQASAAAYSKSTSDAAYSRSSSAAAYSQSVQNAQASAAAYSSSTSAAAYSQSAAAYSQSVASAQASAAAYSSSTSAAAYSQSAAAYSQSAAAYSQSAANAQASAAAYSASQSVAAYSQSVANAASSAAAYSASASLAAYSQSVSDAAASASNAAYSASSSAAAAAAATAIPSGWSAARTACVAEGTKGRAMTGASISSPGMSYGRCIKYCSDQGFVLAGTQYSTECTCSQILENGASLDKPSQSCNMKCGGSDDICGGPNAITLFVANKALGDLSSDFTAKPVALNNGWEVASTACVAEGTSGRALPDATFSAPDMIPSKCMDFCASKNFMYAGLEFGSECHCSTRLQNGASLDKPADSCNMMCAGNPSVYCGGPNGINLYVNPSIGKAIVSASASASQAASDAQNSAAASLQSKLPAGWKPAATTCLHEVSGRALTGASTSGGDMTVPKCVSFCSQQGFTLAGLEYGGECYCSSGNLSNGASMDKTSTQCNMKCSGDDSMICGGPDAISLFTGPAAASPSASASASASSAAAPAGPTPATDLPDGWSAASTNCIQEVNGRALTGYSEASGDMTIRKCISICSNKGFKLSAVEYASECFCGNSLVNGASLDLKSEQCNMPCSGDAKTLCGGPNALQLYSNPNAVAPTSAAASSASASQTASGTTSAPSAGPTPEKNLPNGWTEASTTCLQEVPGRALVGYATTQDDMTIPKCLSLCEARGFYYGAVQWGKECQCGNSLMNGASLDKASNNCNMGCSGSPTTLCGGSDALQLYTNPSLDPARRGVNGFAYGGCIQEVVGRALNMTRLDAADMTIEKCTSFCRDAGYKMAATEYGSECYCGNSLVGGASTSLKSYECKMPCPGNAAQMCGGPDALNLYVAP